MLFCTINDIPAHHCLSGQCKGDQDCFHCLEDTGSLWLNNPKKQVYLRHRCFLPQSHAYRKMKQQFDGTKETSLAPRHFNGKYVYNQVKDINVTFGKKTQTLEKKAQSLERGSGLWKMMIRRGGKRNLFFGSFLIGYIWMFAIALMPCT